MLIINVIKFDPNEERRGAELDGRYMNELWKELGYVIFTDDELKFYGADTTRFTRDQIIAIIQRFKTRCQMENPASIIVYIGSHGYWESICTSDGKLISIMKEVVDEFSHRRLPELQGKPKIFIINSCQNFISSESDCVVEEFNMIDLNVRKESDKVYLPPNNDSVICRSQVPGYTSARDIYKGSHFVYCLTYVMMNYAWKHSFQELLAMVSYY